MSSNGEDRREEEDEEQDLDGTFRFFLELAKPLLLELPLEEDKTLAAAWITRLEANPKDDQEKSLRVDYIGLLLFVMQRGRLIGIFKNRPPEELQPFPSGFGLAEMGNHLLEQAELQGNGDASATGVSYSVEISNDLKEFVAAQEIPDFGVQVYYAWSVDEPIHKWSSFDEKKFPQYVRDKIRQLKVLNSEEKTNVQDGPHGVNSSRKTCVSSIYDRTKVKVKSPQEIEKSLERSSHIWGTCSLQGSSKEDETECKCARRSRSNSKKGSPEATPRRSERSSTRACDRGLQNTDEEGYGLSDSDVSVSAMRGRKKSSSGCEVKTRCQQKEREPPKRIQNTAECTGEAGISLGDIACSYVPGQRAMDPRNARDVCQDPMGMGIPQKPVCPAARYLLCRPPQTAARKTKIGTQGRTCSAPPSACSCPCPREEDPRETVKRKVLSNRPTRTMGEECAQECNYVNGGVNANRSYTRPQDAQVEVENIEPIEGCTCIEGTPSGRKVGLERIGLGKTTPESYISDIKQGQRPQDACPIGGKRTGEAKDGMPVSCLKTPSPVSKKGGYYPPVRPPKTSNVNAACYPQAKAMTPEMGTCPPQQMTYGPSGRPPPQDTASCPPPQMTYTPMGRTPPPEPGSCPPQLSYTPQGRPPPQDTASCPPPQMTYTPMGRTPPPEPGSCPPQLSYTPQGRTPPQDMGPCPQQGGEDSPIYGKVDCAHKDIPGGPSWTSPREMVDGLGTSSAEASICNIQGEGAQDEEVNVQANRYDECAGEEGEDQEAGTGSASSSPDNTGASQNVDETGSECPIGQSPQSQHPFYIHEALQAAMQNYAQPGLQYPFAYGAGNAPFAAPPTSPNYRPQFQVPPYIGAGNQYTSPPGPHYTPPGNPYTPPGNQYTPPGPHYTPPGNPYTPPGQQFSPPVTPPPHQQPFNMPMFLRSPYASEASSSGLYSSSLSTGAPSSYTSSAQTGSLNTQAGATYTVQQGQTFTIPPQGGQTFVIPQGGQTFSISPQGQPLLIGSAPAYPGAYVPPAGYKLTSGRYFAPPGLHTTAPRVRPVETRASPSPTPAPAPAECLLGNLPAMPTTSSPVNAGAPPPSPNFLISPVGQSPGGQQGTRINGGMLIPRSPRSNETWPRMTPRSERRSMLGRSMNRGAEQYLQTRTDFEPDSLIRGDEYSSLSCQFGSYEETPKWVELPRSSRFPRNLADRSTFI